MADTHASFIPKNPNRVKKRVRSTRRIYVLTYISYVLFFGTLLAVIVVYLYKIQVVKVLDAKVEELQVKKHEFSDADIDRVQYLETRLETANRLLNESTAPSKIFEEIELVVAENIQFTQFSYAHLRNNRFTMNLTGKASDFNQIVYQRDLMGRNDLLSSAEIIEYDYSADSNESETTEDSDIQETVFEDTVTISFVFESTLNNSTIAYEPVVLTEILTRDSFVTEVRSGDDARAGEASIIDSNDITN